MPLPVDDRRALVARLAPGGDATADVVADAVEEGEELREVLVDDGDDVVAFTDRRALFVPAGASTVQGFGYDLIDVRRRGDGLHVDAIVEAGRLVLQVARSTFTRLGVVAEGAPPSRATWLPVPPPKPRPAPPAPPLSSLPAPPPGVAGVAFPTVTSPAPPAPATRPAPPASTVAGPTGGTIGFPTAPPPSSPPPGWHPDPSGRHWWRWWDGRDWTDFVGDGGPQFTDPLPPRNPR
jgi:hypothetical protein